MPGRAIEAIAQAVEVVRTANHASLRRSDFDHHDSYRLIGEVSTMAYRLPQLIDQAGAIGRQLHNDDRIAADHGSLDDLMVGWHKSTQAAIAVADDLTAHVDQAFAALSSVRAIEGRPPVDG